MESMFLRVAAVVVAAGGIVYAAHILWVYLLRPLREFTSAQPTLLEIAHEFRPNDGNSLRDRIDLANIRLRNMEQQLETVIDRIGPWDGEERRDNQ
jgi:hypothetical protein